MPVGAGKDAMSPVRVLIADDHADVLSALVSLVDSDPRFLVVGTATTGSAAVLLAQDTAVDLVVLDVRMPGGGPEAAEAILGLPGPPVVVGISAEAGGASAQQMMSAGVADLLVKGHIGATLPDRLAEAWALAGRSGESAPVR